MRVLNIAELTRAGKKNAPLRAALNEWLRLTQDAIWRNIQDVKRTFPTVSGFAVKRTGGDVVVVTVFNIKGNEYRLITLVNYEVASVYVSAVLTHAEYDKELWKGRL